MIKSMTGFGRGEASGKAGRFTVEIRTVNHRYFDMSSRIPASLNQIEDRLKKYVHHYIRRGKVNFSLFYHKHGKGYKSIRLNEEAVEQYYKMLTKVKKNFALHDEVSLSHILLFPDVIVQEQDESELETLWPLIEKAVNKAVLTCNKMRAQEGKALCRDFDQRVGSIVSAVKALEKVAPKVLDNYKDKLKKRLRTLMPKGYDVDKGRLETELALYAKQCDISEEITRIKSHLKSLKAGLLSSKETGRRLDFLLQELQREVNTLGAKAGGVKISTIVINIKSEIEKMREQAQNVE